MEIAKIKIVSKKSSVCIDRNWFPYKDIVDETEFDKVCQCIESYIERCGINKVKVKYLVTETDAQNRPIRILIECTAKIGLFKETESNYILKAK